MNKHPQTIEEARQYRYCKWAGNPSGSPFQEGRCAMEVRESGRGALFYQCRNKSGKGPSGLYCGTHAKEVEAMNPTAQTTQWFTLDWAGKRIQPLEVASSTEKTLTLKGGRTIQRTGMFFRTKDEVMAFLVKRAERRLVAAEIEVEKAKAEFLALANMKRSGEYPTALED